MPEGAAGAATWFGPRARPLFGWVHGAAGEGAPGAVLCPPLARELTAGHYALEVLAERLAGAGMVAVRFDYAGTGDSAGDEGEPFQLGAWLASIDHAVDLARAHGATTISLVGLRSGALLAEIATARRGDVEALVLWDPFVSGKAFLRHERALHVLEAATLAGSADADEVLGFRLDPGTRRELAELTGPADGGTRARRSLVLHRPNDPSLDRLLGRLGTPTTARPLADLRQLFDAPAGEREVPDAAIGAVTAWLGRARPTAAAPARVAATGGCSARAARAVVAASPRGPITERIVRLGPAGLFGIETCPARPEPEAPVVVFLNAARDHHIGPARLWVELARRFAGLGFKSVRLDLSGLGDSPARPGRAPQVIRSVEAFDDVLEAARAIRPDDPSNLVLVGLCSGGYQAIESAIELGARGVLAVNPAPVFVPPEMEGGGPMDARRNACSVPPAARGAYRRVVAPGVRHRLRPLAWWGFRRVRSGDRPAAWLTMLVEKGTDSYVVCGTTESHQLLRGSRRALACLEASERLKVDVVHGLNPGLLPSEQRREVADRFTRHLLERFGGREAAPLGGLKLVSLPGPGDVLERYARAAWEV